MAMWPNIVTGFSACDETINFGTRAFAESGGCLYETSTLATIQASDEVSEKPQLTSGVLSCGAVCVCVDNCLTVFKDETCSTVQFSSAFDSKIETFAATPDGNLLFVGLRNGYIHCLHIPTEGQVVFCKNAKAASKDNQMFSQIIAENVGNVVEVLTVCATGVITSFTSFDFELIHETCMAGGSVEDAVLSVPYEVVSSACAIAPVRSVTSFFRCGQLMLIAVGRGIGIWSEDTDWMCHTYSQETSPYEKLDCLKDKGLILALDAKGELFSVCPDTLLRRRVMANSLSLADFQLVGKSSSEAQILAITAPDEEGKTKLIMSSVVGGEIKLSLAIGWPARLVSSLSDSEDHLFLETIAVKGSDRVDTIAIKAAVQTNPVFRYERMLARQKFEAAEALAKNFGLDMSLLHMGRAQYLLDAIQPLKPGENESKATNENKFVQLIAELDKIKDLDFICKCCVNAISPDFNIARKVLFYAKKRLETFALNNPELESKVAEWSELVCSALLRLETLDLIEPVWDVGKWLEFSRENLMRDVHTRLKKGGIHEAILIWSRHQCEMRFALESELAVRHLLEDIPPWVDLDDIIMWLKCLLPLLLEMQSSALQHIVSWASSKLNSMECTHVKDWPNIGVKYGEKILKILGSQKMMGPFLGLECSPLRPLVELRAALLDMDTLRSQHYIYLTLEEYLQDHREVALLLLDRVEATALNNLILCFLRRFVQQHKLDQDDVIAEYVMRILQCSMGWWHWEEAPWESRVATLIPHITNFKTRIECVVATLDEAPIPWSSTISQLAEESSKLKHPLTSQIREKQKNIVTNLILKKYNLKASINKIDKKCLIRYIILQNHPDMLEDIAQLSQDSEEKAESYMELILHVVDQGDVTTASDVLGSLSDDIVVKIGPKLMTRAGLRIQDDDDSAENFVELLSVVTSRYEVAKATHPPGVDFMEDLYNPLYIPFSVQEIRNRHTLKKLHGKTLAVGDYATTVGKREILTESIQELLIEVEDNEGKETGSEKVDQMYRKSLHLCQLLSLPVAEGVIELAEELLACSDVSPAAAIAKHLIGLPGSPATLHRRMASLAHKFLTKVGVSLNASVAQECATVTRDIASEASVHCDPGELLKVVETLEWTGIWCLSSRRRDFSNVAQQRDAFHQWRFTPLYRDIGVAGLFDNSDLIHFLHKVYTLIQDPENEKDKILPTLPVIARKLQHEQHDFAVIYMLCQLFWSLVSHPDVELLQQARSMIINSTEFLLKKVTSARHLDFDFGLGLLTNLGQEGAIQWLCGGVDGSHIDLHKQRPLAELGVAVCQLWNEFNSYDKFQQAALLSTWGTKLPEHGIPAKELLRDRLGQTGVLKKLVAAKNVTVKLLRAFCVDHNLSLEEVLLLRLQTLLLTWEPDPVITVNHDGTKAVISRNSQEDLLNQCREIQANISDKIVLRKLLSGLWQQVNFYHCEVFLVILELLESLGVAAEINSKRLIITFLKSYQRIKSPEHDEETFWNDVFPSSYGLPPMAEFRLPYSRMLMDNPLKVVKNEVSLDTYKKWIPVAPALDLTKDQICLLAVSNTAVGDEFGGPHVGAEAWCGSIKNEALFSAVAECVAMMDDVGQAGGTLFFFTNKIPPGIDQVNAAALCLEYVEEIIRQTGSVEFRDKVQKKYMTLATTQVLYACGLGEPQYLHLVQSPEELVTELYQHPGIIEWCCGTSATCPDINQAVQNIAELHDLSINTLQMNLIMEWLQPEPIGDNNISLDDDMPSMSHALRQERCEKMQNGAGLLKDGDENIMRARYVMDYGDVEEWGRYLLSIVFEERQACVSLKLRALQCLCVLADSETLEDLSGRSMNSIREYCCTLSYIKELEVLGFPYSESSFTNCNKEELITLMLHNQACTPRAAKLLTQLCINYKVKRMSVWNSVLQHLVDFGMVSELKEVLPHLAQMYHVWNASSFQKAWNLVILTPFAQASIPPTKLEVDAILHALDLLLTCPVKSEIDMAAAMEHCFNKRRPDIAALCLPFVEETSRFVFKEKILSLKETSLLVEDLRQLTAHGLLNFSKVVGMLSDNTPKNILLNDAV